MWSIEKYRPSNSYIILFLILLITSICIILYDKRFLKLELPFKNKLRTAATTPSSNGYLHVQIDLKSKPAICHVNDNLIIYILSTVTNFQRRKVIRSTWASPLTDTCFVFILGKTENYNSIETLVNNEKQQYQDIIQIDHNESYANVIYKEVGALIWSSHFYPFIPYLFKTDDDLIIDSILISDIVRILITNSIDNFSYISKYRPKFNNELLSSDRSTFFRGGWSMDFQPTLRSSKFAVSESVWPYATLPLYCSGFGWLMSKNIRNKLVDAASTYPFNKTVWVGDVFLSGFIAKEANVKCTKLSIDYEQTSSANCSCLMVKNPMLTVCSSSFHAGGGSTEELKYQEYEKAWKVIQQRHSFINRTTTNIDIC
jgi:hypothetical protein